MYFARARTLEDRPTRDERQPKAGRNKMSFQAPALDFFNSRISSISSNYFNTFEKIAASDEARLRSQGIQIFGNKSCHIFLEYSPKNVGRFVLHNSGANNTVVIDVRSAGACNVELRMQGSNGFFSICGAVQPFNFSDILMRSDNQTLVIGDKTTSVATTMELEGKGKRLFIGDDCMFSAGVNIRNYDMHTIFNIDTEEIINEAPKDMTIEKHVWIGFRSVVIGAACIGAGSIVGASSFVNKPVEAASLVAGVPARLLKTNVSWSRHARWVDPADLTLARRLRSGVD